jgi:hypothetical protein
VRKSSNPFARAMHAIAPVPSQTRTHGKPVLFDGGVPALDVAAAPAPALARTVSLPQRRSQVLTVALNCSESGPSRFQAAISASVTGLTERDRSPS